MPIFGAVARSGSQVRGLVAILAALSCSPAVAECWGLAPPESARAEPSVTYRVWPVPVTHIDMFCNFYDAPYGSVRGCAVPVDDEWFIYIRSDLSPEQYQCTLVHEKAHLPPNNWDHGPEWAHSVDKDGNVWASPSMLVRGRGKAADKLLNDLAQYRKTVPPGERFQ